MIVVIIIILIILITITTSHTPRSFVSTMPGLSLQVPSPNFIAFFPFISIRFCKTNDVFATVATQQDDSTAVGRGNTNSGATSGRDVISCRSSHVTRHTSHVTRHTSHVTRHTSHVTSHTSHVTLHTSHVTGCCCCK
jgi:hypothetical protein